jgi:predicted amidophosphoribosyltransferase
MPDTPAERARRYRMRKAGLLPPLQPLICAACGRPRHGTHGILCSRCWERLTPEGRQAKTDRVRRSRARRKHDGA